MKVINRTCLICKGKGIMPRPLYSKEAIDKKMLIAQALKKDGYSYGEIAGFLECSRSMAEKYVKRKV